MFIVKISQSNDCMYFEKTSSLYEQYKDVAVEIASTPEGCGFLKFDGKKVWLEPVSEPTPEQKPQPTPDEDRDAMLVDLATEVALIKLGIYET